MQANKASEPDHYSSPYATVYTQFVSLLPNIIHLIILLFVIGTKIPLPSCNDQVGYKPEPDDFYK
jgi:hypothetical protein